jgi:hypothetical protein
LERINGDSGSSNNGMLTLQDELISAWVYAWKFQNKQFCIIIQVRWAGYAHADFPCPIRGQITRRTLLSQIADILFEFKDMPVSPNKLFARNG